MKVVFFTVILNNLTLIFTGGEGGMLPPIRGVLLPSPLIGVYYRHKKTINNVFLEKLGDNLNKITKSNKTVIITGDFNYDILKYEHTKYINDYLNLMYSNFLLPCITEPTRISGSNRPALLANIFINAYNKNVDSGNIIEKISHHMPNFVIIRNIFDKKKSQKIVIRDMKNFNEEQYLQDLENIKKSDIIQYKSTNDLYSAFHTTFLQIIDKNGLNPYSPNVTFLHPLKTSENQRIFDVFSGYRNVTLGEYGLRN